MYKTLRSFSETFNFIIPKISGGKYKIDFLHKLNWPEMMIRRALYLLPFLNIFCEQADL